MYKTWLYFQGFADQAATMALAARCESGVGVLRHLPGAAVAPLALAAAGAADVLGGFRAHLAPDTSRDRKDKWRRHARDATGLYHDSEVFKEFIPGTRNICSVIIVITTSVFM